MSRRDRFVAYLEDNARAIRTGALVNAIVYIPALQFAVTVTFAGAIGGWLTGMLTHRYGPALRNGFMAGLIGPLITTAIVSVAGLVLWPLVGDNVLLDNGSRMVRLAVVFVPLFAIEGAIGGVAASWFSKTG